MIKLVDFLNELIKNLFTGQVVINFYKGTIGKVQVSKTLKLEELAESDSKYFFSHRVSKFQNFDDFPMFFIVRAVSLENLVSVQIIFGNQPVGLSSRDAQLAETNSFFTKIW